MRNKLFTLCIAFLASTSLWSQSGTCGDNLTWSLENGYRINFTFDKAQKRDIRYALSNTFGFGGHNACLIFKKWEE